MPNYPDEGAGRFHDADDAEKGEEEDGEEGSDAERESLRRPEDGHEQHHVAALRLLQLTQQRRPVGIYSTSRP